jgi:hypothetical protein
MDLLLLFLSPEAASFDRAETRVSDPDSRSVDLDPYSESGSRRPKMTLKSRIKLRNFMF